MRVAADPDADLEGALADWRAYRRKKRVADIHWIDAFYRAYLTGIVGLVAILAISGAIGDGDVSAKGVHDILVHGTPWLGGIAAMAIALGLRSGSRGGPLALERSDVRHVLLSPVDRTTALRGPAIRQLRFLAFVGTLVGAVAGELAAHRLPGATIGWVAVGALGGVTAVGLSIGAALVAAGLHLRRWIASLIALVLVASAGPGRRRRRAREHHRALRAPPPVAARVPHARAGRPRAAALALILVGLTVVGATSLEAAERRVHPRRPAPLRRHLAGPAHGRAPAPPAGARAARVGGRGSGSGSRARAGRPSWCAASTAVLRWPAARMARLALLAVVAGAALRGAWTGTTPLVVVAGLGMFIAGLDGIEPLAQEVDHPTRRDASPFEKGHIHIRHVPVSITVMVWTAAIAAGVAALPGSGQVPVDIAAVLVLPLALGGAGGALVSVLGGSAGFSETWSIAPPEAQGMRLMFRTAWPPGIAIIGSLPILAARSAARDGHAGVGRGHRGGGGRGGPLHLRVRVGAHPRAHRRVVEGPDARGLPDDQQERLEWLMRSSSPSGRARRTAS